MTLHPINLPGDTLANDRVSLEAYLENWAAGDSYREALAGIVLAIANAAPPVDMRLSLGAMPGDPTQVVGYNAAGDRQKALDMAAHDHFISALKHQEIAAILSEEADEVLPGKDGAPFAVAIDPIDGSDGIGIGALLGTLFSISPAMADPVLSFKQSGRAAVAAGYLCFGHSLDLGFSLGDGVIQATFDPLQGQFFVTATDITIPPSTKMIAYNASNQRHWSDGLQRYIAHCHRGAMGPRGQDMNMRWLAAAVGDLHRIMHRGGVFMYPRDTRPGYEEGRLRLLYEAVPIAFLMEQAGGAATDGQVPILDKLPLSHHGYTPLFFGSRMEINTIKNYLGSGPISIE